MQDIVVEPENIYSIGNEIGNMIKVIIKVFPWSFLYMYMYENLECRTVRLLLFNFTRKITGVLQM